MAAALDDLDPANREAFDIFTSDLGAAVVNLAPMATEPVMGLDAGWVRLTLESRAIPEAEWHPMIRKFQILHRAREAARK